MPFTLLQFASCSTSLALQLLLRESCSVNIADVGSEDTGVTPEVAMSLTQDRSSGVDGEDKHEEEELKQDEEGSKEDTATGGECINGGLSLDSSTPLCLLDQLILCFCKIKAAAAINSVALMVDKSDAASNMGTDEL